MAGEIRAASDPLTASAPQPQPSSHAFSPSEIALLEAMRAHPYRFDFFQAVRLLDQVFAEAPPTGTSTRPRQEPIRFGQEPTLAFAPAAIARFEPPRSDSPGHMAVYAVGLLGPNGPMPLVLTDYVRDRKRNHADGALAAFLDNFHHRMIALFYRAWASAHKAVQYERGPADEFAPFVASLIGYAGGWLKRGTGILPFETLLHYSGALSNQSRHAAGLESMLADDLGMPVCLETFIGRWMPVPQEDRCILGGGLAGSVSPSAGLGTTAILGSRVWDCQQTFRLRLGPMSIEDYHRLLPGSDGLRRVTSLVQAYIGEELAWTLRLVLRRDEVPKARLGREGLLGWTTWLGTRPTREDADDLTLAPERWRRGQAAA